jgi:hypothetical protein
MLRWTPRVSPLIIEVNKPLRNITDRSTLAMPDED